MDPRDPALLKIDPELEEIFNQYGRPKPFLPTRQNIHVFRQILDKTTARFMKSPFAVRALNAKSPPTWTEEEVDLPMRDGSTIQARTYKPKDIPREEGVPVLVFFHGGGWCMGGLSTEDFTCRLMCQKLGMVVFNVAYRLYPDVPFPVPVTDSYDAIKWVATNAASFSGNPRRGFIVGGNSGGATYASISAHLARDDGLSPPITGQFLACPILTDEVVDATGNQIGKHLYPDQYLSQEQNWNAPLQDRATREAILDLANFESSSPLLSPFSFASHAGLPPVYVQVCGLDPWRDGGVIYGDFVEKNGGDSRVDIYPGLPHCWWSAYPMVSKTETWLEDTIQGMKWLLECTAPNAGKDSKL